MSDCKGKSHSECKSSNCIWVDGKRKYCRSKVNKTKKANKASPKPLSKPTSRSRSRSRSRSKPIYNNPFPEDIQYNLEKLLDTKSLSTLSRTNKTMKKKLSPFLKKKKI